VTVCRDKQSELQQRVNLQSGAEIAHKNNDTATHIKFTITEYNNAGHYTMFSEVSLDATPWRCRHPPKKCIWSRYDLDL